MKKILLLSTLIALLISCDNTNNKEIRIACNMPMTGDLGYLGEQAQRGLTWALEEYKDTLVNLEYNISIDFQDNEGSAKNAMSIFQKQSLAHPDLYMSGVTSQTMSLAEAVKEKGYLHYIWSFTPLHLQSNDNMIRTWLNLGIEADQYVKIVQSRNCKRVAFAYVDIIGCRQQCEEFVIPALNSILPECDIISIPYPVESTDMKNVILKIKNANPDLIIINGFKNHMINMIKYLHSYEMVKDNNIVGSFDLLDAATDLSSEELEGISMSVPLFMTEGSTPKYKEWAQSFEHKYGKKPEYTEVYAYDGGLMLIEAVKIMKEKEIDFAKALLNVNIEGITGRLHFMENGDLEVPIVLCTFKNHQLIPN